MSKLSSNNSLTTREIQPVVHNQNLRTEFQLNPGSTYISDMRLIDLSAGVNGEYLPNIGAFGLLKTVQLFDGNVLVSSCPNVAQKVAINSLRMSNSKNSELQNHAQQTNWGFNNKLNGSNVLIGENANGAGFGNELARVELQQIIPFLDESKYFSLKNPRLVITWNTAASSVFVKQDVDQPAGKPIVIPEPVLLVDEINGTPPMFKELEFWEWQHDRVTIDAVALTKTSKRKYDVRGFNGKSVRKMIIQDTPETSANVQLGTSAVKQDSTLQVFLDNQPYLPTPIDNVNVQKYNIDNLGALNIPVGLDQYYDPAEPAQKTVVDKLYDSKIAGDYTRSMGWRSVNFRGQLIKDLQIENYRVGSAGAIQSYVQNYYAEVKRSFSKDQNGQAVMSNA